MSYPAKTVLLSFQNRIRFFLGPNLLAGFQTLCCVAECFHCTKQLRLASGALGDLCSRRACGWAPKKTSNMFSHIFLALQKICQKNYDTQGSRNQRAAVSRNYRKRLWQAGSLHRIPTVERACSVPWGWSCMVWRTCSVCTETLATLHQT